MTLRQFLNYLQFLKLHLKIKENTVSVNVYPSYYTELLVINNLVLEDICWIGWFEFWSITFNHWTIIIWLKPSLEQAACKTKWSLSRRIFIFLDLLVSILFIQKSDLIIDILVKIKCVKILQNNDNLIFISCVPSFDFLSLILFYWSEFPEQC